MAITEKCKAIIAKKGEKLEIGEIETPKIGDNEVLIKVFGAGINRPDILQRKGGYPPPKGASEILGLEVSGEVAQIGANVTKWNVGDKVCALLTGGGYAEYARAHEGSCLPIPEGVDIYEAAALPETIFTVYTNVFEGCSLKEGEKFLIHGGSSGIGTSAIQMAKAFGATVYATVGNEEKKAFCESLGADLVINYKTEDFEEIIKEKGGVDVILDMVGGSYIQKNINILRDFGRLCNIAFLQGSKAEINFMRMMLKRLTITGSTLRSRKDEEKAKLAQKVFADIWPLIEAGEYKIMIDSTFDFKDAELAHQRLEEGGHAGKVILKIA